MASVRELLYSIAINGLISEVKEQLSGMMKIFIWRFRVFEEFIISSKW